jgi:predicted nucleic acid-binding protein
MAFVLDASVVGPWALADEPSEAANRIATRLFVEEAIVPPLWWYEVRNLLVVCERRSRIEKSDSDYFLARLDRYPIKIDPEVAKDETLVLARKHRLTIYDAAYLELAIRSSVPLATLDRALEGAARSEGVEIVA